MQAQLGAQLAALSAALPSGASQAQRRALVRAVVIHAAGSDLGASTETCLQLAAEAIEAGAAAAASKVSLHAHLYVDLSSDRRLKASGLTAYR